MLATDPKVVTRTVGDDQDRSPGGEIRGFPAASAVQAPLKLLRLPRARERKHQEDPRLLRTRMSASTDLICCSGHPAALVRTQEHHPPRVHPRADDDGNPSIARHLDRVNTPSR